METAFDADLMDLVVIGESINAVPDGVLAKEPGVSWRDVKGMRDTVGHHYHRIVPQIVHASVRQDLDPLEEAVAPPLAGSLPGDGGSAAGD